jgi:hypothetical protein
MKRYALHALLLVNLALAAVLAWLWLTPAGALRNVHWQAPAPRKSELATMVPPLPGVSTAEPGQYLAMLDRPLFSSTRRPPPPPPPPAPPPPVDTLANARISGVFQSGGIGGIIISVDGRVQRVRLNEAVGGWTLKSIQGRDVTLASGAQTRVMQLPRAALTAYTGAPRQQVGVPPPAPSAPPAQAPAAPRAPSRGAVFGGGSVR